MFGTITAKDGLRLRAAPDAHSVSLELMPYGDRVEILQEHSSGEWLRVRWRNHSGWGFAQYIRRELQVLPTTGKGRLILGIGLIVLVILFASLWAHGASAMLGALPDIPTSGWDGLWWFMAIGASASSILGVGAVGGLAWAVRRARR